MFDVSDTASPGGHDFNPSRIVIIAFRQCAESDVTFGNKSQTKLETKESPQYNTNRRPLDSSILISKY